MTPHDHRVFVPGCFRCELGRDEYEGALVDEVEELRQALGDLLGVAEDMRATSPRSAPARSGGMTRAWSAHAISELFWTTPVVSSGVVASDKEDR